MIKLAAILIGLIMVPSCVFGVGVYPEVKVLMLVQPMLWYEESYVPELRGDVFGYYINVHQDLSGWIWAEYNDDTLDEYGLLWHNDNNEGIKDDLASGVGVLVYNAAHSYDTDGVLLGCYSTWQQRDAAQVNYPSSSSAIRLIEATRNEDDELVDAFGIVLDSSAAAVTDKKTIVCMNTCNSASVIEGCFEECVVGLGYDSDVGSTQANRDMVDFWHEFLTVDSRVATVAGAQILAGSGYSIIGDATATIIDSNGASAIHAFSVCSGIASWDIETHDGSVMFRVEGYSNNAWVPLEDVPADHVGVYEVHNVDPCELYRLVEMYSTGESVIQEYAYPIAVREPIPPIELGELDLQEIEFSQQSVVGGSVVGSAGELLIVTTPELENPVQWYYVPTKEQQGFTVFVETFDETDPALLRQEVKQIMAQYAANGCQLFQIVGDANDYIEFMETVWPTEWQWVQSSYYNSLLPGQPERDIIPTWYEWVATDEEPGATLEYTTPYYATDYPYIDFDNNGIPDEGCAIARLPVADIYEAGSVLYQLYLYAIGVDDIDAPKIGMLVGNVDHDGPHSGHLAELVASCIVSNIETAATIDYLYELDATTTGELNSLLVDAWNTGEWDVVNISGAWSTRYRPGYFFDVTTPDNPFNVGLLCHNLNSYPFLVGSTCQVADFSRSHHQQYGMPVHERLLYHYVKGVVGIIGPTIGSMQTGNMILGPGIMECVTSTDYELLSQRVVDFLRTQMQESPIDGDLFKMANSTVMLMDVCHRMPWQVEPAPPWKEPKTVPINPNPSNPGALLRIDADEAICGDVVVYDVAGREVRRLQCHIVESGSWAVSWDGRDGAGRVMPSGVYTVKAKSKSSTYVGKMTLVK